MAERLLTRYLLGSGTTRMNILLDEVIPRGTVISLKNDSDLGADAGRRWEVLDRFETLEISSIKRKWNNNI